MIQMTVRSPDLLRFARYLETIPRKTNTALARALNVVGDNVLRDVTRRLSEATGLEEVDIAPQIHVNRATPEDLEWSMNAGSVTLEPSPNWQRPWERPGDNTFDGDQLLKIVTSEDGTVCEICDEAAEKSPYTVTEINNMAAKWKDYVSPHTVIGTRTNLLHPNCRCVTVPWLTHRRLNLDFGRGSEPTQSLTMRQLGSIVMQELQASLKVRD